MKLEAVNISAITDPISKFFHRFHTIVFFVIISAGLFVAILILLSTIAVSNELSSTSSERIDGNFDQETMDRIEALESRSETSATPGERSNPFVE